MDKIKNEFPIFEKYPGLAYLDSGATALKPREVIEAEDEYYQDFSANIHRGVYKISEEATDEYERAREVVAKFIGASSSDEVIFTRGTTEALNMVAYGLKLGEGEILVSQMEHHANILPWQRLARESKLKLIYLPMTEDWGIDREKLRNLINDRTRILAITHSSNVLGTVNPIKEIVAEVKKINPKVVVVIDGAQAVAHMPVNVADLGADFYAFSGHKIYGPTGIGVLWGRKKLLETLEPMELGGGMIESVGWHDVIYAKLPERLEAGTPPIAQAIGLAKAIEWLEGVGFEGVHQREKAVLAYAWERLGKIEELNIWGTRNLESRSGVVAFTVKGVHAHDMATILDRFEVCVRSGHHCTMPLHNLMKVEASVRMSLGIYNDNKDIDKLLDGIEGAIKIFKR